MSREVIMSDFPEQPHNHTEDEDEDGDSVKSQEVLNEGLQPQLAPVEVRLDATYKSRMFSAGIYETTDLSPYLKGPGAAAFRTSLQGPLREGTLRQTQAPGMFHAITPYTKEVYQVPENATYTLELGLKCMTLVRMATPNALHACRDVTNRFWGGADPLQGEGGFFTGYCRYDVVFNKAGSAYAVDFAPCSGGYDLFLPGMHAVEGMPDEIMTRVDTNYALMASNFSSATQGEPLLVIGGSRTNRIDVDLINEHGLDLSRLASTPSGWKLFHSDGSTYDYDERQVTLGDHLHVGKHTFGPNVMFWNGEHMDPQNMHSPKRRFAKEAVASPHLNVLNPNRDAAELKVLAFVHSSVRFREAIYVELEKLRAQLNVPYTPEQILETALQFYPRSLIATVSRTRTHGLSAAVYDPDSDLSNVDKELAMDALRIDNRTPLLLKPMANWGARGIQRGPIFKEDTLLHAPASYLFRPENQNTRIRGVYELQQLIDQARFSITTTTNPPFTTERCGRFEVYIVPSTNFNDTWVLPLGTMTSVGKGVQIVHGRTDASCTPVIYL